MQLHVKEGQRGWMQSPISNLSSDAETVPQLFRDYFGEGRHREVVDFDDHLNDIRKCELILPKI